MKNVKVTVFVLLLVECAGSVVASDDITVIVQADRQVVHVDTPFNLVVSLGPHNNQLYKGSARFTESSNLFSFEERGTRAERVGNGNIFSRLNLNQFQGGQWVVDGTSPTPITLADERDVFGIVPAVALQVGDVTFDPNNLADNPLQLASGRFIHKISAFSEQPYPNINFVMRPFRIVQPVAEGDACRLDGECEDGLECHNGICRRPGLGEGEICGENDDCGSNLVCRPVDNELQCLPEGGDGDSCDENDDCGRGLRCFQNQCVDAGGDCNLEIDADCDGVDDDDDIHVACQNTPPGKAVYPAGNDNAGCMLGDIDANGAVDGDDLYDFLGLFNVRDDIASPLTSPLQLSDDNVDRIHGEDLYGFLGVFAARD